MSDKSTNTIRNSSPAPHGEVTSVLRVVALGILLIGCFVIIRPFLSAILWAIILCLSCFPIYSRLLKWFRGRRTLAAFVMTLGIIIVLLGPFVVMGVSFAGDVQRFMSGCYRVLESPPPDPPTWIAKLPLVGARVTAAWYRLSSDTAQVMAYLRQFVGPVTAWLVAVSAYFLRGLAELALSILLAFLLFRDGSAAAMQLLEAGERLAGSNAKPLIELASNTIRGVVYGILGTALVQSIMAGIGLAVAGVPGAGFLALLTFFLAVTPLGAPLVWVPSAVWLYYHVGTGWTIFMVVWGVLISSVDNVIKPMIISRGSSMPLIFILLGVLGGAAAFGLIGVFLGPTLLAVGVRLLQVWTGGLPESNSGPSSP